MKEVPDSYKRFSERQFEKSWGMLDEAIDNLPTCDFNFENFEETGIIFSTDRATCLKCGSDAKVHADIGVQEDPINPKDRIVTFEHWCKDCNKRFGWGFKVTRDRSGE